MKVKLNILLILESSKVRIQNSSFDYFSKMREFEFQMYCKVGLRSWRKLITIKNFKEF